MALLTFEKIDEKTAIGAKGKNLALMANWGLPVPDAFVLTDEPSSEDWKTIYSWWERSGKVPLAIRSSACGEDSAEHSFAGQNSTFLDVSTKEELEKAVDECFQSIHKDSSVAYREHFIGKDVKVKMNVVVQEMVNPKFSGVFFSVDPRGSEGWLLEVVEGYGEALVSAQVTPYIITPNKSDEIKEWESKHSIEISEIGETLKAKLHADVDMEWAIDQEGKLHILQVRPVTTSNDDFKDIIEDEFKRLSSNNAEDTLWDGQSFAEVPGLPSPLTFSVWKEAFAPSMSFEQALKDIGYLGFVKNEFSPKQSVFENVYGRAYVNLEKLNKIFFGPIPYTIDPLPEPHLKFDSSKIDLTTVLRTPISIYHMLKVGLEVSSNRKKWISIIEKELLENKEKMQRPSDPTLYDNWTVPSIKERLSKEIHIFSKYTLKPTFLLILLIQSTNQSLKKIMMSIYKDEKEVDRLFNLWMAKGLKTATSEMGLYFVKASQDETKVPFFLSRYGHRGAGELELMNPRWEELKDTAFKSKSDDSYSLQKEKKHFDISKEIEGLKSFKKVVLKEEWEILKQLLELREKLKMEILRPYSHIRYMAKTLGEKSGLEDLIFWLEQDEIKACDFVNDVEDLRTHALERKKKYEAFKKVSLPLVVSLKELKELNSEEFESSDGVYVGQPISPGVAKGVVRVIRDVKDIDLDNLPQDCIVVTEATDPGWTPVFTKVRGIIVEKGGVLSHCAIVAREMNIPAVSQVIGCYNKLKDGDIVWLDGNNGRIIIK